MNITYELIIDSMYTIEKTDEPNFVVTIGYTYKGTNENGTTFGQSNFVNYSQDSTSSDFIPYEDLTYDIVASWVYADLGTDGVERYQMIIKDMIEAEEIPYQQPTEQPLPF